ncbi:MAG: ABC transporter substrate-binding protein [Roseitalea porphyridii]|jgi:NitT/TauT family transport system substrate-binding protein|uniref:ABC transporter substrate-binding protein n=1 Tax=Roseitalea porphyridii TaxID=1852022 RepID=UPI0032ECDA77
MKNAIFSLAAVAVLSAGSAFARDLDTVTLGSASPWSPYGASLMFGEELGYFAEEGLEPEFVSVQGSSVLIPQLANKSIDFGWPNADLTIIALERGEPFPVKFFLNAYTTQVFEFVVPADSDIESLADLEGKTMGVGALGWGNIPMSRAMLADAGVTWQEDVQVVPVGLGPQAWSRLTSGSVDALNLFVHQHEQMILSGIDLKRIPMPDKFQTIFSNGWATHEDTIAERPELVAAMGRIIAKSTLACQANLEACVRAYWEFDPASKPAPEDEAKWIEETVHLNEADIGVIMSNMDPDRFGYYSNESWENFISALSVGGQIEGTDIDYQQLFTNELIEAINDFDRDEVMAEAQAAQ